MSYDPETATFDDQPAGLIHPDDLHQWETEGGYAAPDLELVDRFEQVQGD